MAEERESREAANEARGQGLARDVEEMEAGQQAETGGTRRNQMIEFQHITNALDALANAAGKLSPELQTQYEEACHSLANAETEEVDKLADAVLKVQAAKKSPWLMQLVTNELLRRERAAAEAVGAVRGK